MYWGEDALTIDFAGYVVSIAYPALAIGCAAVLLFAFIVQAFSALDRLLAVRGCRWSGKPKDNGDPFTKWRCKLCGIEAFSSDGKPPKECKQGLQKAL